MPREGSFRGLLHFQQGSRSGYNEVARRGANSYRKGRQRGGVRGVSAASGGLLGGKEKNQVKKREGEALELGGCEKF